VSFRIAGTATLGRGRFLELLDVVVESPDGEQAHRDVIRHPGGVGILAIDRGEVILVRQYRVAVDDSILEIPAGKLDTPDEDPAIAAVRELEEEIGFTPETVTPLGTMWPSPGYTDELIRLYVATGLSVVDRRPDGVEESHSDIVRLPVDEALARLGKGELVDAKTQLALLLWSRRGT
jgi:ADP-ribose pyrophosphatase